MATILNSLVEQIVKNGFETKGYHHKSKTLRFEIQQQGNRDWHAVYAFFIMSRDTLKYPYKSKKTAVTEFRKDLDLMIEDFTKYTKKYAPKNVILKLINVNDKTKNMKWTNVLPTFINL